jgi:hypothetical protein
MVMKTLLTVKDFFMKPTDLPYDYDEWKNLPFPERAKNVCQAWAIQGFGAPLFAPLFYTLKLIFYVWMWTVFCSYSADLGTTATISHWWFNMEALGKAFLWTILLEGVGFGGASGPLTARYLPPLGGMLYYLRPGTLKVPLFYKIPLLNSTKRNVLDVAVYAAWIYFMIKALIAPHVSPEVVLPIVILLPIMGILDRQMYLAARADVWYPAIFCYLFPEYTGGALKIVLFAIWFWAAFSKLTPTFTSVVSVMLCNSPLMKYFTWLKKSMFVNYPEDLRLSTTANYLAHFGTVVEFLFPALLMTGTFLHWEPTTMFYLLIGMTSFHVFIFINLPIAVPLEWNIMMVYGGWLLFGMHPEIGISPGNWMIALLFSVLFVILPIVGNFFPKYVSFLLSMRYYAGTWAYSIYLFKGDAKTKKLDPNITKTSPDLKKQLNFYYDQKTTDSILSRIIAFRLMHLPSRALHDLLPKAVDKLDDYYWIDGEFLIGEVIGWNFGDGHLHHEPVLKSMQERCHFESGELRTIMVESPQLHNGRMHWRINDAKDGLIEEGYTYIRDLKDKMPWPTDWKKSTT